MLTGDKSQPAAPEDLAVDVEKEGNANPTSVTGGNGTLNTGASKIALTDD